MARATATITIIIRMIMDIPTTKASRTIIIRGRMNQQRVGVFYGVGVGPGAPELITRKAERVLNAVDLIFLPAGTQNGSFVRRIVEPQAHG